MVRGHSHSLVAHFECVPVAGCLPPPIIAVLLHCSGKSQTCPLPSPSPAPSPGTLKQHPELLQAFLGFLLRTLTQCPQHILCREEAGVNVFELGEGNQHTHAHTHTHTHTCTHTQFYCIFNSHCTYLLVHTHAHAGLEALRSAEPGSVSGAGNLLVSLSATLAATQPLSHPPSPHPLPRPQASYISLMDQHILAAQVVAKLGRELVLRILQVGGWGNPFWYDVTGWGDPSASHHMGQPLAH